MELNHDNTDSKREGSTDCPPTPTRWAWLLDKVNDLYTTGVSA